uniref:Uncharacterized protein n=1 Tax=Zea mays TaxID=4577 RepID=A0A804MBQ1_MAIZE
AEAQGGWEDVDERRGLDQDAHGRHRGLRVQQQAAQQDHDLVPPPLEADADAARQREAYELAPAAEALAGEQETAGALVHALEEDVGDEEEEKVQVRQHGGECHPSDAEAEDGDEDVVDGEVDDNGQRGADRERQVDGLRPEVYPHRVDEGLEDEVRERGQNVGLGDRRDAGVLAAEEEERPHVHPQATDGDGRRDEQQHRPLHGDSEEREVARAECLAAYGLHAHGEAGEHGIPRDVGKADGQRPASEGQTAETAEEEH